MSDYQQALESASKELCPSDLNFRKECDENLFKCGAKISWQEGFKSGASWQLDRVREAFANANKNFGWEEYGRECMRIIEALERLK